MTRLVILIAAALPLAAQEDKTRVFITDSQSWEVSGGFGAGASGATGGAGGSVSGGARPQTVEIMKTFRERCPALTITMDKTKADFVILFDREGGKELFQRDNKIAVFRNGGDLVHSGPTRKLGSAVADACSAIRKESSR